MVQRYEKKLIYARGETKKVSKIVKFLARYKGTGYQPGQQTKEKSPHSMQAEWTESG